MNAPDLPDFSQFSVQDFVLDESFRRWILQPDEPTMSFWHTFMLNHPEQQAAIDEASAILLHLRVRYDDLTTASQERIWQVLDLAYDNYRQTHDEQSSAKEPIIRRLVGHPFRRWQVAASLAGVLILAIGGWFYRTNWYRQQIHTRYGETQTVTLPDGSRVQLNANSTLSYRPNWDNDADREVWLDGEAFFKVTKQQTASGRLKFITHTPNLDISVLGTQFNVNTRRGNTVVVLSEGKIQLSQPDNKKAPVILMKPGELAVAQTGIEQVTVKPEKPQRYTAWTRQEFAFDNTPLRDIAQQLNDTWGVTLVFEDNDLAERRFTGNLTSQDLETLLATLAATFDLEVTRNENNIYLRRH
ncbi:FecR domain-containing protein [Spirosoma sp. SC4-14]|uniref:FecR family protein n=1 Tax=Spirosoma sp. SC4-14 TaxID=3128900 RepID=UPI0030CCE59A